jgi:hypothetical protein
MSFDRMNNLVFERSKLRRFGLYLGVAIALYIGAVMLFIIAY